MRLLCDKVWTQSSSFLLPPFFFFKYHFYNSLFPKPRSNVEPFFVWLSSLVKWVTESLEEDASHGENPVAALWVRLSAYHKVLQAACCIFWLDDSRRLSLLLHSICCLTPTHSLKNKKKKREKSMQMSPLDSWDCKMQRRHGRSRFIAGCVCRRFYYFFLRSTFAVVGYTMDTSVALEVQRSFPGNHGCFLFDSCMNLLVCWSVLCINLLLLLLLY